MEFPWNLDSESLLNNALSPLYSGNMVKVKLSYVMKLAKCTVKVLVDLLSNPVLTRTS